MYNGDGGEADKEEQLRVLHEERKAIVDRYDLGREEGAVIDDWEDPKMEIYHRKDRFGFIKDTRLPDDAYRTEKQQKQLEKEMSRLKKWLKMWEQKSLWFPVGSRHHDKMVDRVWKGVPERLRGKLWAILLDLDRIKQEQVGKYEEMKNLARNYSPDIRQIDLDVNRTYRDHEMFRERYNSRQQALFHVLAAYSMFNTEVGYCQGMSQIAALLLMYLNSEEDAFWALSQLMSAPKYNMHGFFIHGFPKLLRFQDHYDKILHKKLRRLQKHLSAQSITTGLYTLKWFFQCFLDRLPFSISIRVWDLYLLEGESIMFATAFTILRLHRKTLLRMQMDELIEFLQQTLAVDFYFEDDYVIEQALRENLQELRSSRLHTAGPPPDVELPQKPFGLVDISQQEKSIVLGSRLRTPVGEDEKELHRNSMRRELDSALRLAQMSHVTDTSLGNNESCESIETPVMGRRQVNHTETQEPGAEQRLHIQNPEPRDSLVHLMSEAVIGQTEADRARPTSLTNQADRPRPSAEVGDKRKSAAADLAQFRLEAAPASFPADSASHTRSSSLLQDSTNTRSSSALHESHTRSSSVLQDTSTSKSASRRSRVSSRTSSRLDTTGSSGVLNSSYEEHQSQAARASYYFGEAPDFRDILGSVNGNGCDNERGGISPHTGEVVRIRVPGTDKVQDNQAQCLSAENIQRLADQQISPSYNGHRVTIKVNRSNEAISNNHSSKVSPGGNALTPIKSRLRTSSVQNIPSNKLTDNGEFLDFSRETFF